MEQLALAHRPRTFDDLVGQKPVQVLLRRMVETRRVPTAMLFDGPRGTGKTSVLRILAAALNCDNPPVPCGHCPSCKSIHDGTSLTLREIDAASHGLVDDIRALRRDVLYSAPGEYRVIGLDEAQSISTAGFNALLKVLEEPPPGIIWVLLTTEPRRILETVYSRCMRFHFKRIAEADIVARLQHVAQAENLTVEPGLITLIAQHAQGGMRDAVMTLDQVTRVGVTTVAGYRDLLGDTDFGPALLAVIATGDHARIFPAVEQVMSGIAEPGTVVAALAETLADILTLRAGGTLTHTGAALDIRKGLAETISTHDAVEAIRLLWDLTARAAKADHARAALTMAVTLIADKLRPAAPEPAAPRRLTLDDIAGMRR